MYSNDNAADGEMLIDVLCGWKYIDDERKAQILAILDNDNLVKRRIRRLIYTATLLALLAMFVVGMMQKNEYIIIAASLAIGFVLAAAAFA